jgi:aspartate kinase
MKFGGTSVGSPEAISSVVHIVQRELDAGSQVIVVVSAMSGVTDTLLAAARMAVEGNRWGYQSSAEALRERHVEAANRLLPPNGVRQKMAQEIGALIDEFTQVCQAVSILGELTPRILDTVVSFGERLSSRLVAAALREQGIAAQAFDAGDLLVTDDRFQQANPLWDETQQRIEARLLPALAAGVTPVITGFLGATREGQHTTLGRGGSDFSGAIFAAATNSDELVIWTDVDGVMTTDPRVDKRARVLPYVSYQEVGELAFYGAKVLHPKTVQPILDRAIPMRVRNTFNPDHPGTLIGMNAEPSSTVVKAVTSIRKVSMLTVSGRGMLGVPGIAGRAFLATASVGASILMISQSSSEQSFCFTVPEDAAESVKRQVEAELHAEIARQNVDGVAVVREVVVITVVGGGMRGTPGVAGRVFTVMGDQRINVLAIAQGSSECSISFVVDEDKLEQAVVALHDLALEALPA